MNMTKKLMTALLMLLALTACQDEPKPDKGAIETFTVNGVSFNMVKVEGGNLTMNMELQITPTNVLYQDSTLNVTIADYSIGQTEVTQALWLAVMGENPSYFSTAEIPFGREREFGDDLSRPVERISWSTCQAFIEKLNELTGRHFRIPSEAEWEFAARGGNKTHGYPYAGSDSIDEVAWYAGNSDNMTHPVGQKKPNELGLYDMSGNVSELCLDHFPFYVPDATGYTLYTLRIYRGGSYNKNCTVWHRGWVAYHESFIGRFNNEIGLRLAE